LHSFEISIFKFERASYFLSRASELVMSSPQIVEVNISFFAHATENENKVLEATRQLLPANCVKEIGFQELRAHGHHGNLIVLFESKIKKKDIVKAVVENFSSNLSILDKEILLREIKLHVDKSNLYLRFDKQAASKGEFKLGVADPIRIQLHFKKNKLEDIVRICRETGMLP
jgi:RNA binding exosome subunit